MTCYDISIWGWPIFIALLVVAIIFLMITAIAKSSSTNLTKLLSNDSRKQRATEKEKEKWKTRLIKRRTKMRILSTISFILLIIIVFIIFNIGITSSIVSGAVNRGADEIFLRDLSIENVMSLSENNKVAPFDNSKKALQYYREGRIDNNTVIIFYRYDCETCATWGKEIENYLATKDIVWCSSRTPDGKTLLDKLRYNENLRIDSVPSMVCKDKMEYKVYELIDESGPEDKVALIPVEKGE